MKLVLVAAAMTAVWAAVAFAWVPPILARRIGLVRIGGAIGIVVVVAALAVAGSGRTEPATSAASAPVAASAPAISAADAAAAAAVPKFDCGRAVHERPGRVRSSIDAVSGVDGSPIPPNGLSRSVPVFRLAGWAFGSDSAHSRGACAVVDGKIVTKETAMYGVARNDVAAIFKEPAMARSGFEIRVPSAALTPGTHRLAVAVVAADGGYTVGPGYVTIKVAP